MRKRPENTGLETMDQSNRSRDTQIALSDLADLLGAASIPEHLKLHPNLAFLTQEHFLRKSSFPNGGG